MDKDSVKRPNKGFFRYFLVFSPLSNAKELIIEAFLEVGLVLLNWFAAHE